MKIKSGCDIVKIERMSAFIEKGGLKRFFTESEEKYIKEKKNPLETAAGIFAAKEALLKALEKGIFQMPLREIEICHKDGGAPYIKLGEEYACLDISLSISHDGEYAMAYVCILEK